MYDFIMIHSRQSHTPIEDKFMRYYKIELQPPSCEISCLYCFEHHHKLSED